MIDDDRYYTKKGVRRPKSSQASDLSRNSEWQRAVGYAKSGCDGGERLSVAWYASQ